MNNVRYFNNIFDLLIIYLDMNFNYNSIRAELRNEKKNKNFKLKNFKLNFYKVF